MLTNLEFNYMNEIARCEMNSINGARPECANEVDTYIWADERAANLGISEKALGGVMSSLIQKGLISCSWEENPADSGVSFTEAGYKVWDEKEKSS